MADHPDFHSLPWTRKLLSDPDLTITVDKAKASEGNMAPNRMFVKLLYQPGAINANVKFWRSCNETDSLYHKEECYLLSLGPLIDGASGRAHGGFNGMVLDQISGSVANESMIDDSVPPATAFLHVDYKAPVSTPCVVLARAWVTKMSGRKIYVNSVMEDGNSRPLAIGKALFIVPRQANL